jgi:hypothetical protein
MVSMYFSTMRAATASIRPGLQFGLLAVLVLAAESALLASPALLQHPLPVRTAVLFDLCAVLPACFWLLVVRPGHARPRTVLRVAVGCIALCALLFGREVRLLALPLELALMALTVVTVRRAMRARGSADATAALRAGLQDALGDTAVARAVSAELVLLWHALFSWGTRPAPGGFTAYKRAGWPAIHFALCLGSVAEGLALHFLLRRIGPLAAAGGLALHAYGLLWLVGDLRALVLRPLRLAGRTLQLRIGLRWEADVPLDDIAAVERSGSEGLRLGVLGSANLVLRLRRPIELHGLLGVRKRADVLLLQVDDPDGLARALGAGAP